MTSETEPEARAVRDPRRWLVVGCGGAGKTHFSRALGRILDLPVIHLDQHYWGPGWAAPAKADWHRRVADLSAGDEWVMDGNYAGSLEPRLERAEAVVMLDLPTWRCLWSIYARGIRHQGSERPDLAKGCPEQLPDRQFLSYVLTYRRRGRPRALRKILAAPDVQFDRLTSRTEATGWLAALERTRQPVP